MSLKDETIVKLEEVSNTLELQNQGVIEFSFKKIISETSNLIMKSKTIFKYGG